MKKIATANTVNETNQIARSSPPRSVPSGTDSTILATIRVLQKKSAIIRIFSRMNLAQFILQRVYHPYYSGYSRSTTFMLNRMEKGLAMTREGKKRAGRDAAGYCSRQKRRRDKL